MKKSILVIQSLMVMVALFMVSCNSDDSIKCPEPLTGELNATESEFAGTWAFSAMMADEAIDLTNDNTANPSKDIYAQYSACDRDLVYDFMNDRKYSLKQAFVAPDCDNKQTLTGTWSLTGKALTFLANCSSQTIQIEKSEAGDEFSFVSIVNFRDVSGGIKSANVTFTYEKVVVDNTPQ